jgi:hypothetical protein
LSEYFQDTISFPSLTVLQAILQPIVSPDIAHAALNQQTLIERELLVDSHNALSSILIFRLYFSGYKLFFEHTNGVQPVEEDYPASLD